MSKEGIEHHQIPLIGLGTFKLRTNENKETVYNVLDVAISCGYRLFDTASCYRNEKDIGDALQKLYIKHNISRGDIYITSKLAPKDMTYEKTLQSCTQSIADLQCTYLDYYLIHWPGRAKLKPEDDQHISARKEVWCAMQELKSKGLVRNIGVSNFTIKHLDELLSYGGVKPMLNQVEFHVHLAQKELLQYCQLNGILLQSYSSLGTGLLLNDPVVTEIAEKNNRTPAQILLKWVLQQGVSVIPKSTNGEHIASNFSLNDFCIEDDDMDRLFQLNIDKHYCWDPAKIV